MDNIFRSLIYSVLGRGWEHGLEGLVLAAATFKPTQNAKHLSSGYHSVEFEAPASLASTTHIEVFSV